MQCLAWSGAGVVWVLNAGVPRSFSLGGEAFAAEIKRGDFVFAQISDSHIGFNKDANPDPGATLQSALDKLKIVRPAFLLHTGDVSHLSKPEEFDVAAQLIGSTHLETHYVPGEHDVLNENPKLFFQRFTPSAPKGWYSFDYNGVHFVALVNVMNFKAGGLGNIGDEQLVWLEQDLRGKSASTPIVVFTHIPLWAVYPTWGWATDDSDKALALLHRFGSVTVLNGHIHQVMQKVEGNVTFHTGMSTAYPQPEPGKAAGPGPLKVPADQLRNVLGTSNIAVASKPSKLTITDNTLAAQAVSAADDFLNSMFAGD
jgi:3',5'-cyclic AMP phosphodiesterase CpdA